MDVHLLIDNLTNPALLFFFLGVIAVQLKSHLKIPETSPKFISLYLLFAIVIPIINGLLVAVVSGLFVDGIGNRLLFAILAASASYIAVPAAMKIAAPKVNPSLYIPMALAITFPFNITFSMPFYL